MNGKEYEVGQSFANNYIQTCTYMREDSVE